MSVHAQTRGVKRRRRPNLSFRVSHDVKAALEKRARLRSAAQKQKVTPSDVARGLIEHALALTDEETGAAPDESLLDEVMASALFARRAFELVLSSHEGLAEKLLRACRKEVRRRKRSHLDEKGRTNR